MDSSLDFAINADKKDPLAECRQQFHFPTNEAGDTQFYFCGNSLGLQPKNCQAYVQAELDIWLQHGVEGHFVEPHPWYAYHETVTSALARLVGAEDREVVAMNGLSVNLHLLLTSFYRPTAKKNKILIEAGAFPSDRYAVSSQIRFHGFDPKTALIEIAPREGEDILRSDDILQLIEQQGDEIALILFGGVQYLTGQAFDMASITKAGHEHQCFVGFDLAHAIGNLIMRLHDWQVDFAVWCSYKYLNASPGGIGGAFVHENHVSDPQIPRFEGWWGTDKQKRFLMSREFEPIQSAEAWQLSNPPILQLACLRASLDIFEKVDLEMLRHKGHQLTTYMSYLLAQWLSDDVTIITPQNLNERGNQLSLKLSVNAKSVQQKLAKHNVICDFREPDVLRLGCAPLYNTYQDVYHFVRILKEILHD